MRTRSPLRFGSEYTVAALLVCCAASATAQAPEAGKPRTVRPMTLNQTTYRLRAGEPTSVDAPRETLDFLLHAKTRRIEIDGKEAPGIVIAPNRAGDQILLAASLRMKPGEYAVKLSGTSEGGEERITTLAVVLDPLQTVPSTATQPPVVLLNGWQPPTWSSLLLSGSTCPPSTPEETFGSLSNDLQASDGVPVAYWFDNCVEDANMPIEILGNDLGEVLDLIQYDTGAPVRQVDLVTHSMGGLIARAYLTGLQTNGVLLPPTPTKIRKLVQIAAPNFGAFLAAIGYGDVGNTIGTQAMEMIPGSAFLWELNKWNQGTDDLRGIDALAIVGDQGEWLNGTGTAGQNLSDGVVSITSASLGFARDVSRTRILSHCHIESVGIEIDCSGDAIASANDTISAVLSFLLNNTPGWTIGLTFADYQQGGVYVGVENSTQYVNDLSQVQFAGSALVQNPQYAVFYGDFLPAGQGTVQFTSASLGSFRLPEPHFRERIRYFE